MSAALQKSFRVWRPDEAAALERMTLAGHDDESIAAALDRTVQSVACVRVKIGLRIRGTGEMRIRTAKPLLLAGMTPDEVGRQLGLDRSHVRHMATILGIGPRQPCATPRPLTGPIVRDYTKAEIAWARANIRDPQARLIAGIVTGIPMRVFEDTRIRLNPGRGRAAGGEVASVRPAK